MNTARRNGIGFGTQTAAVAAGGFTTVRTGATELWNGTSWTTNPSSMTTARTEFAGAGSQTSGLAIGGYTTVEVSSTEEWTGQALQTKTITVS